MVYNREIESACTLCMCCRMCCCHGCRMCCCHGLSRLLYSLCVCVQDETDGVAARIKFSLTGKRRKNKKSSPKILPSENPAPTNHSPAPPPPSTSSPSSSLSSSTTTPIPPSLPKTSISPPPSISSNASLPALPTDTHPLLEDAAPANHDLVTSSLPHPLPPTPPPNLITPNVREEARLEQSSSEESLAEDEQEEEEEEKVGGGGEGRGANKVVGTTQKDVGRCLSVEDEGRVRSFVTEFVAQRLVPHLEAVLKNLNEWVGPKYLSPRVSL